MTIIETPVFTRHIKGILSDNEYRRMQWTLAINPEAGLLIPQGRGLRKLRWAIPGKGKSGGLRVIYYWYSEEGIIYLLFPYLKSDQGDLTQKQMKLLIEYVKDGVL